MELLTRAYELGKQLWRDYASIFSRRDFTQPQLFACLVLRESLKVSYRRAEVFLGDVPDWLKAIELDHAPDHNTLWRAFGTLLKPSRFERALDVMAQAHKQVLNADLKVLPLTMDATCYEPRHRSRHYDRVCRRIASESEKNPAKRGKYGPKANRSRSRALKRMPKLAIAASAATHQILAVRTAIGNGSDAPDFVPLLQAAAKRVKVKVVVADAGYDSEANHCVAREQLHIRSIIPAAIGRPTTKAPTGHHRRNMKNRFARGTDARIYRHRCQSETINSMMKRNLTEYLRSLKSQRRKQELWLRCITHNLMLGREKDKG